MLAPLTNPNLDWSPGEILIQTPQFPEMLPPQHGIQQAYLNFYDIDFARLFKVDHFTSQLSVDGYQIHLHYVRHQVGVNQNKGTVLFLHGLFDHVGLFGHAFRCWLERGYDLVLIDLPGHGLSTGQMASIRSFQEYEDVLTKILNLREVFSEGRWIGAGQSTGGAIWINHMVQHQLKKPPVDELLLFSPLVRPAHHARIKGMYAILKHFVTDVKRNFQPNSGHQEFLDFVREQDPLQSKWLTAQWVKAMLEWSHAMETVLQDGCYQSLSEHIHVVQGTSDQTVDWKYNLDWIHKVFPNADIKTIEKAGHHGLNETPELDKLLWATLDAWLGDA